MLLYLHSALVRLLLANVIGLRMVLSGAVSFGHVVSSLVCNRAAPTLIPDAQFPGTVVLFCHRTLCMHHLLLVILLCHIGLGMMLSITIIFCSMSAFEVVHIN